MQGDRQSRLDRIQRFSRICRAICTALFSVIPVLFVVAAAGVIFRAGVTLHFFNMTIPTDPLAFNSRFGMVLALAITMGVLAKALHHLRRLFDNFTRGEIFTTESARQIRQLGITIILWSFVGVLWAIIAVLQMSGPRPIPLQLDSLFIGGVVVVISWFMDEAAALREELDLTI